MELDFFILFSSGAAVWGSKDLAPYAAANQFLDTLAHYRRRRGLPALAINWGWWAGGGTTQEVERYFRQIGLNPMPDLECLEALKFLILCGAVQSAVSDFDWSILGPIFEAKKHRPFLEMLLVSGQSTRPHKAGAEATDLRRRLEICSLDNRWNILIDHIRSVTAQVLGIESPDRLDLKQGFFSMGMDSITTLQLKNLLEASMGLKLPQTVAFEHPNIEALSTYIATEILSLPLPGQPSIESRQEQETMTFQKRNEMLSEEDLVALLSRKLEDLHNDA
jgi:acyl carrier protein